MKNLLLILLLSPFITYAQHDFTTTNLSTEKRIFKDSSGTYIVQYDYDVFGNATIPATLPAGAPHYDAYITVFKLKGKDTLIVGQTFNGTYVRGGCFEDRPIDMVNEAKRLQLLTITKK